MFSGIESGLMEVLVGHLKVHFHGGSCTGTRLVSARTPINASTAPMSVPPIASTTLSAND